MFIPVRIRGTVTCRTYGSRNLFVGVSWKREDCWNGGSARIFLAVFNFTVDDFFNENQEIKVRSTSSDVGLSHFLFIT